MVQSGLQFLANGTTGSDIRLNWSGANLLSRTTHTVIWLAQYFQQTGYYANTWHTSNDGTWHASSYEMGAHPYPCDGTDSFGQANVGSSTTVHYMEMAGLGGQDLIAQPGAATLIVKDGRWYAQARKCEIISGTTLRHTVWADVLNAPNNVIQFESALGSLATPTTPAFIIGCSPWTSSNWAGAGSGYTNSECPGSIMRGIRQFAAGLAIADIQTEVAAIGNNTAASSAGQSSVWYINDNPTPSDVSDKSGAGHSPSWANANRPTLWTS